MVSIDKFVLIVYLIVGTYGMFKLDYKTHNYEIKINISCSALLGKTM